MCIWSCSLHVQSYMCGEFVDLMRTSADPGPAWDQIYAFTIITPVQLSSVTPHPVTMILRCVLLLTVVVLPFYYSQGEV